MIQMLDLKKQYAAIKDEVLAEINQVLDSAHYILGPKGKELEKRIADYTGVKDAVGVASGTDALHLPLRAMGIGPGDEVITTPFTFFATVEAIEYVGATPVFVDIRPDTFNIDVDRIEEKVTPRTKAIIPVHLYGCPADMPKLMEIARRNDLRVIEDCAQSIGAAINGRMTGSFGDAGAFSFYPSKNLGAYGDGGIITLRDETLGDGVRMYRNHGSAKTYYHDEIGYNSRLDEIQAAILLVKFRRIDQYNDARRRKAALYNQALAGLAATPVEPAGCRHVYHQYTIRHPRRDNVKQALFDAGIASAVYYPVPQHLQPAMRKHGFTEGLCPVAERAAAEVLSLPICPELDESAIGRMADVIKRV